MEILLVDPPQRRGPPGGRRALRAVVGSMVPEGLAAWFDRPTLGYTGSMPGTVDALTLSVSIERSPREVYEFVVDPRNLPRWASGLGSAVEEADGHWVVTTPEGLAELRFAARNDLGVLDHTVLTPGGLEVRVPMRVVPNGSGSEVLFTLLRQPGMSDEDFHRDAGLVQRDLRTLKHELELAEPS